LKGIHVPASDIPSELIDAYRATNYRVLGENPFVLKIGQSSVPLKNLYHEHGCRSAAFLTAWNPFSRPTANDENSRLQALLEIELSGVSTALVPGIGEDSSGQWPGEESTLALGLSLSDAKSIGIRFEQNAFVWIDGDANPELLILK
jgi:hypothetical protein